MKRKRKVTITKVRRRTMTVTTTALTVWCPFCKREVETVSKAEATAALQLAGRILEGALDSGRLHVIEIGNVDTRICKRSLISE